MKYLDYIEEKQQGTFDFPIAFYHVESSHPRYQMPYHWHPEYEIIRILKGRFLLTIDGQQIIAGENDIILIQGGTLHGGVPDDCTYECLVFDMKILLGNNRLCNRQIQQLVRHEISINLKLPCDQEPLKRVTHDLFTAMNEKKYGYEFIIQGNLYTLFGIIFSLEAYQINKSDTSVSTLQINRLKDVLNYIEEHYSESISLEDMARVAGLSPRYFCRFFRKMTQCTPTEYLNYYRIECACEQLAEITVSITDVALNCGFNNISYFIKAFHKAKGVTPKQYKETSRQFTNY